MEISVVNNVPGIKVTVNKSEDGTFAILLAEDHQKMLGSVPCGGIVKIGDCDFIVLEHINDNTAVIKKTFASTMKFCDDGYEGDYRTSKVRKYCNGKFYEALAQVVGKENIMEHTVDLEADDGTGKGVQCDDYVSILTNDLYRRYRDYLPAYGNWWWTATRVNATCPDYTRAVCCIDKDGILIQRGCCYCEGVRPFFILNSSVLVSEE